MALALDTSLRADCLGKVAAELFARWNDRLKHHGRLPGDHKGNPIIRFFWKGAVTAMALRDKPAAQPVLGITLGLQGQGPGPLPPHQGDGVAGDGHRLARRAEAGDRQRRLRRSSRSRTSTRPTT